MVVCWIMIGWGLAPGLQGLDSPRPVLVLDNHDQPWTAWVERQGSVTVARVVRWDGSAWVSVGGTLNRSPSKSVVSVSLVLGSDGTAWTAWAENPGILHVARYTGKTWEESAPLPVQSPDARIERPQVKLNSQGRPWVMWSEISPTFRWEHVFLATLDKGWTIVDTATTSLRLSGRARDLAIGSDGHPVTVFSRRAEGKEFQVTASRWDGQSWNSLGTGLNLNPDAYSGFPVLVLDSQGWPTVAFLQASSGFKLVVQRWTGSAWELLGTPGSLGARNPKLALSLGNAPVLAAVERIVGITVRQRSNAGWVDLGSVISTPGAFVDTLDLAVDSQGDPWLVWAEDDAQGQRLRLSHWMGNRWDSLTPPPFSPK